MKTQTVNISFSDDLLKDIDAVSHEEANKCVGPNESRQLPAEGRHKEPIDRNQRRYRLRAEHRHP